MRFPGAGDFDVVLLAPGHFQIDGAWVGQYVSCRGVSWLSWAMCGGMRPLLGAWCTAAPALDAGGVTCVCRGGREMVVLARIVRLRVLVSAPTVWTRGSVEQVWVLTSLCFRRPPPLLLVAMAPGIRTHPLACTHARIDTHDQRVFAARLRAVPWPTAS